MKASQIMIAMRAQGKGYADMLAAVQAMEAAQKPKRAKPSKAAGYDFPCPEGVDGELWSDFVTIRKSKKAPITSTVMAAIGREALLLGWSLERAITVMIERNWQGFKADWVKEKQNGTANRTSPQNGKTADGWSSVLRDVANRSDDGDRDHNAGPVRGPPRLGFGPS